MKKNNQFGSISEAIAYPILLVLIMWMVFWGDHLFPETDFYKYGIKPFEFSSLKGILFMPLIHSNREIGHIINNTPPTIILLAAIVYYYRSIAFKVFTLSWLFTGIGVWFFAVNNNSYHIGMSGVVYAMAAFLFTSGIIRKHRNLQGIALFVAFVYGGMIWGVFPVEEKISWEGHLSGMVTGVLLALLYRKKGPQPVKYLYEIEKELGIEPPDLEGEWNEKIRFEKERIEALEKAKEEKRKAAEQNIQIVYRYIPKDGDKTKED